MLEHRILNRLVFKYLNTSDTLEDEDFELLCNDPDLSEAFDATITICSICNYWAETTDTTLNKYNDYICDDCK